MKTITITDVYLEFDKLVLLRELYDYKRTASVLFEDTARQFKIFVEFSSLAPSRQASRHAWLFHSYRNQSKSAAESASKFTHSFWKDILKPYAESKGMFCKYGDPDMLGKSFDCYVETYKPTICLVGDFSWVALNKV